MLRAELHRVRDDVCINMQQVSQFDTKIDS